MRWAEAVLVTVTMALVCYANPDAVLYVAACMFVAGVWVGRASES